ncbi:methyltransferase domain-containing protein [Pontibacter diazotrophicus]|uniref:Methyltransferase domain-containing protein n=1 Tax=Pontibacter diazotrophicus TaxID=1400979 RepID=A0A3D8LDH4_9BACT|nr:methyltransferase domain-containing protein [Pontibacter diazotrophicus]RDV15509.1 methyltransferase domain-containing protein [Pontibacter diazotrophicus]
MLKRRSNELELMDDLTLSSEDLRRNLDELEVINHWLGGHKVVLDALSKLAAKHKSQPLRIADIGCGGGDTLKNIARWARRKNIPVELIGIDANDFMVQYARQRCADFQEIRVEQHDVFSETFAQQPYDVIVCSLFCHHFTDAQLVQMFRQLYQQAQLGVIINDLHRHWLAYYSIKYITTAFSGSYLVKNDAPLSVWRAFKRDELQQLVKQAGVRTYKLRWMWAFRWQLLLQKS